MKTAADVMNQTFFHAAPSDTIGVLLHEMAERGLGCVPVLDRAGRPLGVATTAEIERCYDIEELIERLESPVVCVDQNTPIDIVARALARQPSCCLVLVDGGGLAVGALSPLELLAATLGCEDATAGVKQERDAAWEAADILELGATRRAPASPGIILLSPGLDENKKRLVWAEPAANMRERLDQMLREPQDEQALEALLDRYPRTVRFRCLTIQDAEQREQLAEALCNVGRNSSRAARAQLDPEPSMHGPAGVRAAERPAPLAS